MFEQLSSITIIKTIPLTFLIEVAIILAVLLIVGRAVNYIEKKTPEEKRSNIFHIIVSGVTKTLIPFLFMLFLYTRFDALEISVKAKKIGLIIILFVIVFFIVRFLVTLLKKFIESKAGENPAGLLRPSTVGFVVTIARFMLWAIGLVFILDNAGFSISAIVTGLGIGGLAIALASQNILGDLFNYIAIMFDKPFEIGDFIIAGEHLGVVEHVGIRTTRIRSLSGEQIVVSNTDLTGTRIRNFKSMERRRVAFNIDVPFETPIDKLREIPIKIKEIIENIPEDAVFDRCHVKEISQYSFKIETIFFVLGADFVKYMDVQEKINLDIKEFFDKNDINFAYPTRKTLSETK